MKDKEDETKSFKKNIILSDNEDENDYKYNYEIYDRYIQEENDYEFYNKTLNILHKNILEYIIDKNLQIGEYLTLETIDKFLSKIRNF